MISTEKQMLRERVRGTLRAMGDAERAARSAAIASNLRGLGGLVLAFAPMRLEPDWTAAVGAGWELAFPRIEGDGLAFYRAAGLSELAKGARGTREPIAGRPVSACEADVILTPGVAFDRRGARLGRGGGFYDRLLSGGALSARRVAVCFACQVVERVPVEPHDAEVDAIVTEDGWIDVRSRRPGRD